MINFCCQMCVGAMVSNNSSQLFYKLIFFNALTLPLVKTYNTREDLP